MVKAFSAFEEDAVEPLTALLNDSETDEELAWFLVKILGQFQTPEAILALVNLLDSSQPDDLSAIAAQMLAGMGPQVLGSLAPLLEDPARQLQGVRAIAQIDHPDTVSLLVEVWSQEPAAEVRRLILEALGRFQDPTRVGIFLTGLQDSEAEVRQAAIAGLMAYRNSPRLEEEDWLDAVTEPIVECLSDRSIEVAEQAARALGKVGTEAATAALIKACCREGGRPSLQHSIVQALGWIGSSPSLEGLMQIWESLSEVPLRSEPLLKEVLLSLSRTKDRPKAVAYIVSLLRTPALEASLPLKSAAAFGLGRLGNESALDPLIEMLAHSDYALRLQVTAALKQLSPQLAYKKIQQRAADSTTQDDWAAGLATAMQEW